MATDVELCNQALSQLNTALITSLNDTSAQGVLCKLHFQSTLYEALRVCQWGFAIKEEPLAMPSDWEQYIDGLSVENPNYSELNDEPQYITTRGSLRYSYAYVYPNDCLYAIEILRNPNLDVVDYKKISNKQNTGSVLLCSVLDPVLSYVSREPNRANADYLFDQYIVQSMIMKIGASINSGSPAYATAPQMLLQIEGEAIAANNNEGNEKDIYYNDILEARDG